MAKHTNDDKEQSDSLLKFFGLDQKEHGMKEGTPETEEKLQPTEPRASLETIGLTDCSVCGKEVSVVLTRTKHPFTACGRCGARTFYNSAIAIQLLKNRLREVDLD